MTSCKFDTSFVLLLVELISYITYCKGIDITGDCGTYTLLTVRYRRCAPLMCNDTILDDCTYERPLVSIDEELLSDSKSYILLIAESNVPVSQNEMFSYPFWLLANIPKDSLIDGRVTGLELIEYLQPNPKFIVPEITEDIHEFKVFLYEQAFFEIDTVRARSLLIHYLVRSNFTDAGFVEALDRTTIFGRRVGAFVFRQGPVHSLRDISDVSDSLETTAAATTVETLAGGTGSPQENVEGDQQTSFPLWLIAVIILVALAVILLVIIIASRQKENENKVEKRESIVKASSFVKNEAAVVESATKSVMTDEVITQNSRVTSATGKDTVKSNDTGGDSMESGTTGNYSLESDATGNYSLDSEGTDFSGSTNSSKDSRLTMATENKPVFSFFPSFRQ